MTMIFGVTYHSHTFMVYLPDLFIHPLFLFREHRCCSVNSAFALRLRGIHYASSISDFLGILVP